MRPKTRLHIAEVGVHLDSVIVGIRSPEGPAQSARTKKPTSQPVNRRARERQVITVPARLAWKDQRGVSRFASVVTRDVSESGVFIECPSAWPIPLYRLLHFQAGTTG